MLKKLLELYLTFFKIGAVTFGGGYAMLPILERELVDKKHWASYEDLLDYYAISQVTPGVIAVNVSTFVGYKIKKVPGGIFATLGLVTPSIVIITLIAMFISNFQEIELVRKALAGINVGVAALLSYAVVNFAKKSIKKWWGIIFYAASFAAIYFLKLPSVVVIVASAVCGILVTWLSGGLKKVEMKENASESTESTESTEASDEKKEDAEKC